MKKMRSILPSRSGRGASGRIAVRHRGGRHKRFLRDIAFSRANGDVGAVVEAIEYDPNRTANVALLLFEDGRREYVLASAGMVEGDVIKFGKGTVVKPGNVMPLAKIPVGTSVHSLEVRPGKGGQLVRAAGTSAVVQGREDEEVVVKLPSGEIKRFPAESLATVGEIAGGVGMSGGVRSRALRGQLGRAGRKRRQGIRPTVRGVAMHPGAHPHGGGEGRSGVGMPTPKTPWGKKARGVRTRRVKKYSDKLILERRR